MPSYITKIIDTIAPKNIAESAKILQIEDNIINGQSNQIMELDGDAFILDADEDAFLMTPVTTTVDQSCSAATDWYPLKSESLRQTIPTEKSSIETLSVSLKNTAGYDILIQGEIQNGNTGEGEENGDTLLNFSFNLPAGTDENIYRVEIGLDHLPKDDYSFVLKKTTVDGASVRFDIDGSYVKGMMVSEDNVLWTVTPYDITFTQEYTTGFAYDIKPANAVVMGQKPISLDTHVKALASSTEGNRIDVVVYDQYGQYSIIEGEVSSKPVEPEIPDGLLVIAHLTVKAKETDIVKIILDQDDSLGYNRPRSQNEYIRRLMKRDDYNFRYNPPKRIKYNLEAAV